MGISAGKGCIRFSKPGKINFEVVEKLSPGSFLHKAQSAKMFSEANNHGWYGGKEINTTCIFIF